MDLQLTKKEEYATMVLHTVIVCPFVAIIPNMVILSQEGTAVKGKVIEI